MSPQPVKRHACTHCRHVHTRTRTRAGGGCNRGHAADAFQQIGLGLPADALVTQQAGRRTQERAQLLKATQTVWRLQGVDESSTDGASEEGGGGRLRAVRCSTVALAQAGRDEGASVRARLGACVPDARRAAETRTHHQCHAHPVTRSVKNGVQTSKRGSHAC
jgi:hypothetical protein